MTEQGNDTDGKFFMPTNSKTINNFESNCFFAFAVCLI